MPARSLAAISREIVACRRCPRLVAHCQRVAREKVRRHRDESYWGKPVPGFGDPAARLVVVGLAPAAHGANRTGRMFTGDSSGDWLYRALHRGGFASQPTSVARNDGLVLRDVWVTAAGRCAPPENKPATTELAACRPFLERELGALREARVLLALGRIGFDAALGAWSASQGSRPQPRPAFAHGAEARLDAHLVLLASYHPSRQNTQTGRLTERMLDAIVDRARALLEGE